MKKVLILLLCLVVVMGIAIYCGGVEVEEEEPGGDVPGVELEEIVVVARFSCVIAVSPGMVVYEDSGCMVELSELEIGDIEPGEVGGGSFWLKNEGEVDFVTVTTSAGSTPGYNAVVLSDGFSLLVGEVVKVDVEVQCEETLVEGDYEFNIYLVGSGV